MLDIERPSEEPPRERYIYYPGTSPVPEGVAVNVRGRSYKILADVEITDPNCSGVIFAHGSRFGGHSLFIKDKKLHYVYNFLGIKPEQQFVSPELKPGKYTLGMEFTREKARPVPRVDGHDEALRQRQGRGRRPDARAGRQVRLEVTCSRTNWSLASSYRPIGGWLQAITMLYCCPFSISVASRCPGAGRVDSVMSCPHAARMSRPRDLRTDTVTR